MRLRGVLKIKKKISITIDENILSKIDTIVDNIFDSFYEYSVLGANGQPFPKTDLNILRDSGVCLIQTNPNTDGIYFARLNLVQKDQLLAGVLQIKTSV